MSQYYHLIALVIITLLISCCEINDPFASSEDYYEKKVGYFEGDYNGNIKPLTDWVRLENPNPVILGANHSINTFYIEDVYPEIINIVDYNRWTTLRTKILDEGSIISFSTEGSNILFNVDRLYYIKNIATGIVKQVLTDTTYRFIEEPSWLNDTELVFRLSKKTELSRLPRFYTFNFDNEELIKIYDVFSNRGFALTSNKQIIIYSITEYFEKEPPVSNIYYKNLITGDSLHLGEGYFPKFYDGTNSFIYEIYVESSRQFWSCDTSGLIQLLFDAKDFSTNPTITDDGSQLYHVTNDSVYLTDFNNENVIKIMDFKDPNLIKNNINFEESAILHFQPIFHPDKKRIFYGIQLQYIY